MYFCTKNCEFICVLKLHHNILYHQIQNFWIGHLDIHDVQLQILTWHHQLLKSYVKCWRLMSNFDANIKIWLPIIRIWMSIKGNSLHQTLRFWFFSSIFDVGSQNLDVKMSRRTSKFSKMRHTIVHLVDVFKTPKFRVSSRILISLHQNMTVWSMMKLLWIPKIDVKHQCFIVNDKSLIVSNKMSTITFRCKCRSLQLIRLTKKLIWYDMVHRHVYWLSSVVFMVP